MDHERWLSVAEIADQLRVDEQTVRRWIRGGRLAARRLGSKAGYRIRPSDLQAFLDSLDVTEPTQAAARERERRERETAIVKLSEILGVTSDELMTALDEVKTAA